MLASYHPSVPQSPDVCDGLHGSVHHRETPLLCAQLRKVYRFPTEDHRWLTVRDELSETPLSFSVPRQLLRVLIHEHTSRYVSLFFNPCPVQQHHHLDSSGTEIFGFTKTSL